MLKLLIVDDEKRTRDGLKQCISWKDCGYGEIRDADDGKTALEILRDFEPDIILSDILMPKMTGIDMAKQVQTQLPQCKFVFISGHSDKEYLKNAIQLKAFSYIEKPIHVPELEACMRKVAAECESEQRKRKNEDEVAARLETSVEWLRSNFALYLAERHTQPGTIRHMLDLSRLEWPANGTYVSAVFQCSSPGNASAAFEPGLPPRLFEVVCDRLSADAITFSAGIKDGRQILIHVLLSGSMSKDKLRSALACVAHEFEQPGKPCMSGLD
jgi:two-component system response regulator YesN